MTGKEPSNLLEFLNIEVVEESDGHMVMSMPITPKVHQTKGFIHGGANVVLAETAASVGASRLIGNDEIAFGMEINANHLRTVRDGMIYATARMRHRGKSTQVWEIDITDDDDNLTCVSRCTMAVKKKR
ncbi:PaaI family thioesterase [Salinicoccus halitifaciens]|uniref:Uncharacterized protein (TIGR00369 family) n=1 Tax=Salinicoccus halitifaciens TaxID=1073415 RepID=A0ABV2ECT2_9STAP|nr:PaaI family thioesterase [Salinicoccus halitifaciens]